MRAHIRKLTIAAMGAAMVCLATTVIRIPIPLGYAHLGNCVILLFGACFGPWIGAFAGGVGSALADLLGYPVWALPTLIIKTLMGLAVGLVAGKRKTLSPVRSGRAFLGTLLGIVIMVLGYFAAGSVIYGSVVTGAAQIPGLALEGLAGMVLFYVIGGALEAAGIMKRIRNIQGRDGLAPQSSEKNRRHQ